MMYENGMHPEKGEGVPRMAGSGLSALPAVQ